MPRLRLVFAAAAAVLPLLNIVNTLKPVPVFFGPQTHREFIDDLYEEAFAPDTFGRPLPELKDVWRFFDSTIVLALLPEEIEDSPSVVLTPKSPPREYPSSLFMDFEQPAFRPCLASSMSLDLVMYHLHPSSTNLAEPTARPVDSVHPLAILPMIVSPPPSAAYVILGHVLLGGVMFGLFVLAVVILALRWAMAPASSTITRAPVMSESLRPSGIPRWFPRVTSSFDAVGESESSSAAFCATAPGVIEEPERGTGEEEVGQMEELDSLDAVPVVDAPQVSEIPQPSAEDVDQMQETEATAFVDAPQTPTQLAVPSPQSSPISLEPAVTATGDLDRVRSDSTPGAIIYQTSAPSKSPVSPIPGSVVYETPTATSQTSSAPGLIIYQTPLPPRKPAVLCQSDAATLNPYSGQVPRPTVPPANLYHNAACLNFGGRITLPLPGSTAPNFYYSAYAPTSLWPHQAYHIHAVDNKTHSMW